MHLLTAFKKEEYNLLIVCCVLTVGLLFILGCYLSFPTNKLVSGEHCKIVQDAGSGVVWLEDMRYLVINR